jgi:MFS family permease
MPDRRSSVFRQVGTSTGLVFAGYLPVNAFGILAAPMANGTAISLAGLNLGPSALFATASLMSVVVPHLLARTTMRRIVLTSIVASGTGRLLVAAAPNLWVLVLGLAACGAIVALFGVPWATVQMITLLKLPSARSAVAIDWRTVTAGFLGMSAGPVLFASAAEKWGFPAAWMLIGAIALAGVPAALMYVWAAAGVEGAVSSQDRREGGAHGREG